MNSLPVLFGYNVDGIGNSSVPFSLCKHWNNAGKESRLYAPSSDHHLTFPWLKPAMGSVRKKVVYRFGKDTSPKEIAESFFFKKEKNSRHVYLWAALSLEIFQKLKDQNTHIIVERINCHQRTAKTILDQMYDQMGFDPDHNITDESIALENAKLSLADAIFCPSPMVYDSLVENGVDGSKLLPTSYGWSPGRFPDYDRQKRKNVKPKFLFVGTLCVRKGVPLLLQAWEKSNIDAELILCGNMDKIIQQQFGHYFDRDDVHHIPFSRDIGQYYSQADVFVLPTLEEGGPMVTYEAMAHGVVPLVTKMGAGSIVTDKKNGLIMPDNDVDLWTQALRALNDNSLKRMELARAAQERALQFTWENVAAQRAKLLKEKLPTLWNS